VVPTEFSIKSDKHLKKDRHGGQKDRHMLDQMYRKTKMFLSARQLRFRFKGKIDRCWKKTIRGSNELKTIKFDKKADCGLKKTPTEILSCRKRLK
jgi:hypothetical protein